MITDSVLNLVRQTKVSGESQNKVRGSSYDFEIFR